MLIIATVAAAYFAANRGSTSGAPQDFVHTSERLGREGRSIPALANPVQRFLELHGFDAASQHVIEAMARDVVRLHHIADGSSGSDKAIADQAATSANEILDAALRYRTAVAFTYRLGNASQAEQDLNAAADTLNQQAKAWTHG